MLWIPNTGTFAPNSSQKIHFVKFKEWSGDHPLEWLNTEITHYFRKIYRFCEIYICSFYVAAPPYWLSIHQGSSHGILQICSHSSHWENGENSKVLLSLLSVAILFSRLPRFIGAWWLQPTYFHILIFLFQNLVRLSFRRFQEKRDLSRFVIKTINLSD